VSVHGSAKAYPGFYRGALFSVGVQSTAPLVPLTLKAPQLRGISLSAIDNDTIAMQFNAGMNGPDRFSADVRDVTIDGGLVGVMLQNWTQNVRLRDVSVSRAVWGFGVFNHSSGNVIEDSVAMRCCRAFFAAATTSANRFKRNDAISCDSSYVDLGAGNYMAVGSGVNENIELGTSNTGACNLTNAVFTQTIFGLSRRSADDDDVDNTAEIREIQRRTAQTQFIDRGLAPSGMTVDEVVELVQQRIDSRFEYATEAA
jgi:hypothetical protein